MSDLEEYLGVVGTDLSGRVSDPEHHCYGCGAYIAEVWMFRYKMTCVEDPTRPICKKCWDTLMESFEGQHGTS